MKKLKTVSRINGDRVETCTTFELHETISKAFDWLDVLGALAHDDNAFGERDKLHLIDLSKQWPTCACGQLCRQLPKLEGDSGAPADADTRILGNQFHLDVVRRNWVAALCIFHRIERRTTQLLEGRVIIVS